MGIWLVDLPAMIAHIVLPKMTTKPPLIVTNTPPSLPMAVRISTINEGGWLFGV